MGLDKLGYRFAKTFVLDVYLKRFPVLPTLGNIVAETKEEGKKNITVKFTNIRYSANVIFVAETKSLCLFNLGSMAETR